jgi:hypothetical protein
MITPKWLNTKCQPIAINDVLDFFSKSLLNPNIQSKFRHWRTDSYKEMLLGYAKSKNLKDGFYRTYNDTQIIFPGCICNINIL